MIHSHYTRNILNIEDKNIHFFENCLETKKIKGIVTKIFHALLTYTPDYCPICGTLSASSNNIIKWGFKKNCKIKIPKVSNYNTILNLHKQRFYCKHCNNTFIASTPLIDRGKQISNNSKLSITLNLMSKNSEKDTAFRNNVSTNTANRILSNISKDKLIANNGKLPSVMGIDEFKATKDTKSKMALIIVDHNSKNIFDINSSRFSNDIEKYFKRYSKKERDKVKFITVDLYKPYYQLFSKLFRKAIIVPGRFHIVLQIRNALDKTRINLCKKSNPNYNKLKKYWKLILKFNEDLDCKTKRYSPNFRKDISEYDIVNYLINTNSELKATYNIYQGILKSIRTKDKDTFCKIIHHYDSNISIHAKKAIKTFLDMEKYIINAFKYDYSNGIVEGTNNVIKSIKRSAYGYRKFTHFKARIMLVKGRYNNLFA